MGILPIIMPTIYNLGKTDITSAIYLALSGYIVAIRKVSCSPHPGTFSFEKIFFRRRVAGAVSPKISAIGLPWPTVCWQVLWRK